MHDTIAEPSRPAELSQEPSRGRGAAVFNVVAGWVLLACFVVSFGALVLQGSVSASHHDLRKRLESDAHAGVTTTVEVARPGGWRAGIATTPMEGQGYASVDVRWREGLLHRHAEYLVASSASEARKAQEQNSSDRPRPVVIAPDTLEGEWSELQPNLVIDEVDGEGFLGGTTELFGAEWSGPSWAVLFGGLVAGLGTLTRLVVGPQPWRLTRWGWAWLVLLAWPIGVPMFLLLSGATGLFRPTDPERRAGGFVGLLCALVVAGLFTFALA